MSDLDGSATTTTTTHRTYSLKQVCRTSGSSGGDPSSATEGPTDPQTSSPFQDLLDLIHLFFAGIDEQDPNEKSCLINGVINECDRILRESSHQEEDNNSNKHSVGKFANHSPAFYNIYGQALHHLWYDKFESYLVYSEKSILDLLENENSAAGAASLDRLETFYKTRLLAEQEFKLLLKISCDQFKKSLQWTKASPEKRVQIEDLPEDMVSSLDKEDLEDAIELIDICSLPASIQAELTRTYLLHLLWLPIRYDPNVSNEGKLSTLRSKFNKFFKSERALQVEDPSLDPEIKDLLLEEVENIHLWVENCLLVAKLTSFAATKLKSDSLKKIYQQILENDNNFVEAFPLNLEVNEDEDEEEDLEETDVLGGAARKYLCTKEGEEGMVEDIDGSIAYISTYMTLLSDLSF